MADTSALDVAYMKGHELGRAAAEAEVRALREALEQIKREAGASEHWVMPTEGRLKSALDGITLLAERAIAAARAPA